MSNWYKSIVNDLGVLPDAIEFYENELDIARRELSLKGKTIEKHSAELPGIVELRYGQLQEIEAILEFLNIQMRKLRSKKFKTYLEKYQRALSSRDAEKYVDGDVDVYNMAVLLNEFALVRNKFLGILKALETKQFQVNNIVKLRTAGIEDATI